MQRLLCLSATNTSRASKRNVRGSALESLLKYADRVSYAYKGKLDKHAEINHPRPQGFMILLQRVFLDTHERLATMKIY